MARILVALLWAAGLAWATGSAAGVARGLREAGLDPEQCYRVRELTLSREDIRLYFTDGHLIFTRPVAGLRTGAVFTADAESGDGEVLVLPPDRSERRSLASYTGTPNLNEHLATAVMVFSDDTAEELLAQIAANPFNRRRPEVGVLMAEQWSPVARNIGASFETRLVLDLLSGRPRSRGFFTAAVTGRKLGNFDILYDPRAPEQVVVGQVAARDNRAFFDVWTSFEARASRRRPREAQPDFELSDYRIKATLEPDLQLKVLTRVKVRPGSEPQAVLPFDVARPIVISSALVDGRPAEVFERESLRATLIGNTGNEMFLVVPPEPLAPGREYEFEFQQEGRVIFEAGNHVYYVGARANWYPKRGLQFATYDLTFRYPGDLDLVTAGEVVEDRTEGQWRVTRRRTGPIRLAGFNLGRYDHARAARGNYSVEVYANRTLERALQPRPSEPMLVRPPMTPGRQRRPEMLSLPPAPPPPPDPTTRLPELASDVAAALEFMAGHFGPPALPALTVSPVPGAFGQGFPGLIYLSTLAYLGPQHKSIAALSEQQQLFFSEILQAHETAHQWWGNVVTAAGYRDEWLLEALANYSALLYLEKRKGARPFGDVLEQYRQNLLLRNESGAIVDSAGPVVLGGRLESSLEPRAWRTIVYGKGSWILHMLRRAMGDQRFLAMLAELRRRYEGKGLSTAQFRELAAGFLPPGSPDPRLEAFFAQWIEGTGIPDLKLTWSVKGKAPALRLTGTVRQSEVDDDFSVRVPVEIQVARGKSITHWVRTAGEPVSFTVPLRQPPLKVTLDPGSTILKR
jgi:hypothetical protein